MSEHGHGGGGHGGGGSLIESVLGNLPGPDNMLDAAIGKGSIVEEAAKAIDKVIPDFPLPFEKGKGGGGGGASHGGGHGGGHH